MRSFIRFFPLIILIAISQIFAQTDIPDKEEVSGVWQIEGSPYRINGEAIVPVDSQLIIQPGVRVEFKTGSNHEYANPAFDLGLLRVQGCLQVRGTADQPVIFTRQSDAGNWGLIFFDEGATDSSYLSFAKIEYASYIQYLQNWIDYYGALSIADAAITIENCRIINNANDGLYIKQAPVTISNCLIARNGQNGIRALSQSDLQITNVTVADNQQSGLDCGVNSQPQIINSVFWDNQNDLLLGNYSQISVSYSLLETSEVPGGVQSGKGNLWGKNPLFVDAPSGNYRLSANSFAVNSGTPDTTGLSLPATDADGQTRLAHGRIDMGAFERTDDYLRLTHPNGNEPFLAQTSESIRWQTNLSQVELQFSPDNGQSWQSVATVNSSTTFDWQTPDIHSEACLLKVIAGDNPTMADVCDTSFIISDHAIIRDGLKIAGHWTKNMSPVEIRGTAIVPPDSVLTIEAGVQIWLHAGRQFNFQSSDFDAGFLWVQGNLSAQGSEQDSILFTTKDSGHWATLLFDHADSILSGLKYVKIEQAAGIDSVNGQNYPAALALDNTNCELSHLHISRNATSGLLLSGESAPAVHNCRIDSNEISGIVVQSASRFSRPELFANRVTFNNRHGILLKDLTAAYVHDNIIEHNDSTGIYLQTGYATPVIENNRIGYQNFGIWCDNTAPKLVGDVVYHADTGIVLRTCSPDLGNVTLAKNKTAIDCQDASPVLTNTLFGQNTRDFVFAAGDNSAPTVSYCLTDQPYFATNIIDAGFNRLNTSAKFVGTGEHPFAITRGSAAIDHGTDENSLITLPEFDVAGNPRILDGNHDAADQVDIGAYEFAELIAGFKADPTSGAVPLIVHFSDQSVGNINSRQWDFGDGSESQETNPSHIYTNAGKFTVRLVVQGEAGRDTLIRQNYIYTKYPPFVCHPLADTSFAEDAGWQFIKSMRTVFCDSDSASSLTYSVKHSSSKVQISWQHDSLFVRSDTNFAGNDQLIVTAKDSIGLSVSDSFNVTFRQVNDPPVRSKALPDSLIFSSDSTVQLPLWDYYADVETPDQNLKFSIGTSSDSILARYDSTDGLLSIFSAPNFSGQANLFIRVQDDSGAALNDTIHLKVTLPTALKESSQPVIPAVFFMSQGFPNPFNPEATIRYGLPRAEKIEIDLFDILGRKISVLFAGQRNAGTYALKIDGDRLGLSSGIYFVILHSRHFQARQKIILIK